jgi:arsenate reductase-like glutaredoxin family protein
MPKRIDWLYHRNSCVTCRRAEACRTKLGAKVVEQVDARKVRYGEAEALALLDGIDTLIVTRGKTVVINMLNSPVQERPTDAELLALLMGPTGNLRAPTARVGRTLVVGFSDAVYEHLLRARKA